MAHQSWSWSAGSRKCRDLSSRTFCKFGPSSAPDFRSTRHFSLNSNAPCRSWYSTRIVRPVEHHVGVAVVTCVDFFAVLVAAVVPREPPAFVDIGQRAALDRHASVPDAAAVGGNPALHGILVVNRELVLVSPEPDHRPMNDPSPIAAKESGTTRRMTNGCRDATAE